MTGAGRKTEWQTVENLKLLIIEDDADQRDSTRETLEDHFGRGTVVAVGTRAQAVCQPLESFDMILSDYNLPDATGMELLQEVRKRCSTPVILVTGENVGHIAVEAIKKGATDYIVKLGDYLFTIPLVVQKNITVAKVMRENETLRQELENKNAELVASLQRERELAATDPLTGLYNRRYLVEQAPRIWRQARRDGTRVAAMVLDLDHFKRLNDAHGHAAGDAVLRAVAGALSSSVRPADVLARTGGEELVVLGMVSDGAEAARLAERLRAAVAASRTDAGHAVTASIGVALTRPVDGEVAGDALWRLVDRADAAMYEAKQQGRDRVAALLIPHPAPARPVTSDRPATDVA